MLQDPLQTKSLAPQPPLPPEIEGYLKKLKRKTSNLTGSWNKRWFFVDPKRLEFGYSNNRAPNAPRSSIYLNDITAVLQFDDTHFQVESRTRNFFLCGESKASTTCWVKSLEEYRKKQVEYEKAMSRLATSLPSPSTAATVELSPASSASTVSMGDYAVAAVTNQVRGGGASGNRPGTSTKKPRHREDPARDSQDSSSFSAQASSSSNLVEDKPARLMMVPGDSDVLDERRAASPIDAPSSSRHEQRRSKPSDRRNDGDSCSRTSERGREQERERDRTRHRQRDRDTDDERGSTRDRSTSAQRRSRPDSGSSRTNSGRSIRAGGAATGYAGHPTNGYVMHAWTDEFD